MHRLYHFILSAPNAPLYLTQRTLNFINRTDLVGLLKLGHKKPWTLSHGTFSKPIHQLRSPRNIKKPCVQVCRLRTTAELQADSQHHCGPWSESTWTSKLQRTASLATIYLPAVPRSSTSEPSGPAQSAHRTKRYTIINCYISPWILVVIC